MLERRDNNLQRLQEDMATLTNQLQSAVQAKCEALANVDEVESVKLALDYREKRLDQERGLLNQQVQSLTEDLAKHTADMTNMRREYTNNLVTLRTQLAEKTEELKIATSTNKQLSETNSTLNQRVEALTQRLLGQCESENKMNENYQQEIRAQTKLAELYKSLSEDATAKNEELTEAVKELQRLLKEATDQYGDLETKLREKEVALEVTTEKKNLCIQELKKELEHANELIEATKLQSIEKAVESLSPAAAATSRLLKSGITLTQLYMQYAEASEQLMLEREENKRLNHSINTILQLFEDDLAQPSTSKEGFCDNKSYCTTLNDLELSDNSDSTLGSEENIPEDVDDSDLDPWFSPEVNVKDKRCTLFKRRKVQRPQSILLQNDMEKNLRPMHSN
ncbi:hypothetical protein J6590_002557 [Homalodisca vitripennis]|nr:hypothetical protein J6590_002557 [Homalodisca vitripennis]